MWLWKIVWGRCVPARSANGKESLHKVYRVTGYLKGAPAQLIGRDDSIGKVRGEGIDRKVEGMKGFMCD